MNRVVPFGIVLFIIVLFGFMTCWTPRVEHDRSQSEAAATSDDKTQRDMIKSRLVVRELVDDDTIVSAESLVTTKTSIANSSDEVLGRMERIRQVSRLRGAEKMSLTPASSFHEGEADCAICLANFEKGQRVCEASNIKCTHMFHEDCMTSWLLKHSKCPICRAPYLKETI